MPCHITANINYSIKRTDHGFLERISNRKIQNPVLPVEIPFRTGCSVRFTYRNGQIKTNNQNIKIQTQTGSDSDCDLLIKLRCELRSGSGGIGKSRPYIPGIDEKCPANHRNNFE